MEGAAVTLIIKAPNQQIKDQVVNCDVGWTIGRLKEYLTEVYPSKPERANQKLIYSGQLLNDSAYLKDVLRQCDDTKDQAYTIHLVCACQNSFSDTIQSSKRIQSPENLNSTSVSRNASENARSNDIQNQNLENNISMQSTNAQLYSAQQYFDPRNSQQMAWMQQAYTHYFTQYMQFMAAQGFQLHNRISYVPQMNINSTENVQNVYVNNNNVGEEQPPVAQDAGDFNAGNNNGAGEDGAFNRDWLDFFYMLSRIVVLFSILYFYSSPLRFLIVTSLGFAIYLYQGGFFRVQPILLAENNNGRIDNNNQVLQNEAIGPQPAPAQQNGQTPMVQPETRTNIVEGNEEERPGALAFTWTFFSSFFASLIPDQPNVL